MEIALVVLSIFSLSLVIAYTAIVKKLKIVNEAFAKIFISYSSIANAVDVKNLSTISEDLDIHKENFIKFLSDSRDWAFDYIEEVQNGLKQFIDKVEPAVNHFDEYGIIAQGSPHYKDMKIISENFKQLKKLLPEETNDRR